MVAVAVAAVLVIAALRRRRDARRSRRARSSRCVGASTVVAFSALLFHAAARAHDPAINQGNPTTLVAARRRDRRDGSTTWPGCGRGRRRSGCSSRTGSSTPTGSSRCRSAPTVIPTVARVAATVAVRGARRRRRALASRASTDATWTRGRCCCSCAASLGVIVVSQPQGGRVVRLAVRAGRRAPRSARARLLLRPRLLGVGHLGGHGRDCARASDCDCPTCARRSSSPRCRSRSTGRR